MVRNEIIKELRGTTTASTLVGTNHDSSEVVPNEHMTPIESHRSSRVKAEILDSRRIAFAKPGFSTRRVPKEDMRTLVSGAMRPRTGDVVLARVDRIRQQERIELPTGRKAFLEPGDEIILACGNRYATDQYEAFVPERLGRAHLIAAGGVAAVETERARKMKPATEITLLGLIGDASGLPLNLISYALPVPKTDNTRPPVIAVFGTSMNSGKTTTARFLTRGLAAAGFNVGYAKLTGTGAGNDYWAIFDSRASAVVDFTDAGFASTYKIPITAIETISVNLIGHLVSQGCDRIVVEIADGLLQVETAAIMDSSIFHGLVDRVLFASGDAIAAIAGVRMLQEHGFEVAGVTGLVTASPLPCREAACACGVHVWGKGDLMNPETAARIATYSSGSCKAANAPSVETEKKSSTPMKKRENVIVDTKELPTVKPEETVVLCSSLDELVKVANALSKPVLHQAWDHTHTYCINDGLVRYEYTSKFEVPDDRDEFREQVRGRIEEELKKSREEMKG